MKFCDKLKLLREEKNMTLAEFADLLGTSKQVISRYERGENTPKITTVAHYAKVLNVSLAFLMNDNEMDRTATMSAHKKNTPNEQTLTEGEEKLLRFYRGLSIDTRKLFDESIDSFGNFSEEKQKLAVQMLHFSLGNQ